MWAAKGSRRTLPGLFASVVVVSGASVAFSSVALSSVALSSVASASAPSTSSATIERSTTAAAAAAAGRIYGATADATAAAALETAFPATRTSTCVGGELTAADDRPVILATDQHFADALSSQYLAGYLDTGTLLTPGTSLSTATKEAFKTEGVTEVYVVGGSLAVTTAVVAEIEALPAYTCGGSAVLKSGTATRDVTVTRLAGATQYDTAEQIAVTPPSSYVKALAFPDAYAGLNITGGDGKYNDTAGSGSASHTSAAMRTAIVASGTEFQDAEASSAFAYGTGVPILLTSPTSLSTAAVSAIQALQIAQVVVMGGPLAVSNAVVTSLEALGVAVLRVAGKSYTDTATKFAEFLVGAAGSKGVGWVLDRAPNATHTVTVARGNGYTDGLAGADVSGRDHEPLLLTTSPTAVGTYLTGFLKASGRSSKGVDTAGTAGKIENLTVFGGPSAVTTAVVSQMQDDLV
jgi:putative cell wall-binding protein